MTFASALNFHHLYYCQVFRILEISAIGGRVRDDGETIEELIAITSSVQRFINGSFEVIRVVTSENAVVLRPIFELLMCGGK